ncbi:GntR family transcriptional regulator [Actinoplanes sp. NPDC049118]|uniref:GntR family transcriptional regulator n=1 Tax=Actinoplanes sp. NPDC049118 TaxID=3155769 RepID=UPI0033FC5169
MPIEPAAAKYASIASALQHRIDSGAYPVGAMLPSEAQLVREFDASRSTVVRSLEYLRQLGYIEGVQGKGRVVLGRPAALASQPPGRIRAALHSVEAPDATLIGAGRAPASARIAAMLSIPVAEPVIARQRHFPATGMNWPMLNTVYLPAVASSGTAFHLPHLLREGALDHLERRRRLVAMDVVERLSLRTASARESTLLTLGRRASVLASLLVVRNVAGHPLLVVDVVIPVPAEGLREAFKLR